MNRLQLKCFMVSTALHGLMAIALLVGMGLSATHHVPDDLPMLEVIPSRLIDEALAGGGDPRPPGPPPSQATPVKPAENTALPPVAQPPAAPESKPVSTPVITPPPKPKPAQPQNIIDQEEDKLPLPDSKPPKVQKPVVNSDEPTPETTKKDSAAKPKKSMELKRTTLAAVSGKSVKEEQAKEQQEAADRAAESARVAAVNAWRDQLGNAVGSIRRNLSSATTIEVGGGGVGGTGGEAYAGYGLVIRSIFDRAWRDPEEVEDLKLSVRTKIVIARSGKVLSTDIVQRSGNAAMDKSVQQALDRVRQVPAFPAESHDAERVFYINFNLKAKRSIG
jgi:TonB family protein